MPAAHAGAAAAILDLISPQEHKLLRFETRLRSLLAIQAEIARRVGDGTFRIANELVWDSLLDNRDALYLHMGSWAKALVEPGGFFGQLKSKSLATFFVPEPDAELKGLDAITATARRDAFKARFPDAACRGSVKPRDIDALKDAFYPKMEDVQDTRHLLAHRFEKRQAHVTEFPGLAPLRAALVEAQEFFNHLRLFIEDSTLSYDIAPPPGTSDTSADLVDLLFFGSFTGLLVDSGADGQLDKAAGAYFWQYRSAFLQRLRDLAAVPGERDDINSLDRLHQAAAAVADGDLARATLHRDPFPLP